MAVKALRGIRIPNPTEADIERGYHFSLAKISDVPDKEIIEAIDLVAQIKEVKTDYWELEKGDKFGVGSNAFKD